MMDYLCYHYNLSLPPILPLPSSPSPPPSLPLWSLYCCGIIIAFLLIYLLFKVPTSSFVVLTLKNKHCMCQVRKYCEQLITFKLSSVNSFVYYIIIIIIHDASGIHILVLCSYCKCTDPLYSIIVLAPFMIVQPCQTVSYIIHPSE